MTPFPAARPGGTRFRVFPQTYEGYVEPEVVTVNLPAGSIGPGPSDPWMHVANAVDKTVPYKPDSYLPPYLGPVYPPALPDGQGHFDWIPVEAPQFRAAHAYAIVRLTLDVWERHLGRRIEWWFAGAYPSLEIVPLASWPNAQSGLGYLEAGEVTNRFGTVDPFWMDFDVIAHETGHMTLFSTIGVPDWATVHGAFLAFHEAFADLFAVTGTLRFLSVRQRLLQQTEGDLYVTNLVSRVGELSSVSQIRIASNQTTMAEVAGLRLEPDGRWFDPEGKGRDVFDLAAPLLGAVFDILVEIYQDGLVARRLIPDETGPRGWTRAEVARSLDRISMESRRAYAAFAEGFEESLDEARDAVCACIAHVMRTLRPQTLTFDTVAARFIEGAQQAGLGRLAPELIGHFLSRGIDPRPHLGREPPPFVPRRVPLPVLASARPGRPPPRPHCRSCGRMDAFVLAGRLMPHEGRRQAAGRLTADDAGATSASPI